MLASIRVYRLIVEARLDTREEQPAKNAAGKKALRQLNKVCGQVLLIYKIDQRSKDDGEQYIACKGHPITRVIGERSHHQ